MSGDFEKNISQRMEGFHISPHQQVWERVSAALPAEKRRRRFPIWWLLPLAACLGGGVWLMIDKQKRADDKRIADVARNTFAEDGNFKKLSKPASVDTAGSYTIQQDDNKPKDLLSKKQNGLQQKADIHKRELVVNNQSKKSKQRKEPLQAGNLTVVTKAEIPIYKNVLLKKHSRISTNQTEEVDYMLNHAAGNAAVKKALISDSNFLNKEPVLPLVDLTGILSPEIVTKNDTALLKLTDTLLKNTVGIKIPKAIRNNKKPEWSLMIAVGKSSLTNGSSNGNKALNANYQNSTGGLAGNVNIGTFSNPTDGFNFSTGIMRSQTIGKHFSWQAELNYQLLTTKQRVGGRNDSLERFDALTTRNAFYTAGRTGNAPGAIRLNQVHRLQVAPGIRYTLNPAASSPLSLVAAASIAYNVSNNLLLHDYRSYSYVHSSSLSNKLMLGGQAGLALFINHKIYAGIYFQQDFTNVAKAKVGSVFRWNQMQLRISVPLSKHK